MSLARKAVPALLFSLLLLGTSACTTVQTNSFGNAPVVSATGNSGQQASYGTIQVLYSEPRRDYESLGSFSVRKYKPGFSDSTVTDALPELRKAAGQLQADAVIIRNTQSNNTRFLTIEGEAIRWR